MADDNDSKLGVLIDLAMERADRALAVVEDKLPRDSRGHPLPTVSNAIWLMARVPNLQGLFAFNEFSGEPLLMREPPIIEDGEPVGGPYPRMWEKGEVILVQAYMQRRWMSKWSRETIEDAMLATAVQNRFHPVREYFEKLEWDRVPRLDEWLMNAFGVEDDDAGYARAVGSKTLIAAVRRVRFPGSKFDYVLVVEGGQGKGKSTVFNVLFGDEWFDDGLPGDLQNKDSALALQGLLGMEVAEIEKMIRAESAVVKAFLSRRVDRFRPPYGRGMVKRPRQGIIVGTTNESDYLRDPTGNRRYWPVVSSKADVEWVRENRDQLWAEAVEREKLGELVYLRGTQLGAAEDEQKNRVFSHAWTEKVLDWAWERPWVTTAQVLEHALNITPDRFDRRKEMDVAEILALDGWQRTRAMVGGKRRYRFMRPDRPPPVGTQQELPNPFIHDE